MTNGYRFDVWKCGSKGLTTQDLLMPAADTHIDQALHASMLGKSQGGLVYMIGQHLMWNDIVGDEFLSCSTDPLFLVVHALNRYHENQGDATIQFLDCQTVKNIKGGPAAFYPGLDIYETFEVPNWEGWSHTAKGKLRARKFTEEFLSHGTLIFSDARFQQASIEKLIQDGLYDLFPAFQVPNNHIRAGFYGGQVVFRVAGYPPSEDNRVWRSPHLLVRSLCESCAIQHGVS